MTTDIHTIENILSLNDGMVTIVLDERSTSKLMKYCIKILRVQNIFE